MSRPKISIIVPVYNGEKYLEHCLWSLKTQTMTDFEVVMCDNASTDGSFEIMKNFADNDPRFRIVSHSTNIGQCGNMISGLKECEGEYIAECDADDFVDPSMYQKLCGYADRYNCQVVQCGWIDYMRRAMWPRRITVYDVCISQKDMDVKGRGIFLSFQPHIMSCIYRRSWIKDNDLWYRDGKQYEDTSLTFKHRSFADRYGIIAESLYYYRKDNEAAGTFTNLNVYGIMEQYREIDRFNAEKNLQLDEYITMMRYYTYRWQYNRIPSEEKRLFFKKAAADMRGRVTNPELFEKGMDWEDFSAWINA